MKTHLETAHEYGVKQALKQHGYSSLEEVTKEAQDLGLVAAEAPAEDPISRILSGLKK